MSKVPFISAVGPNSTNDVYVAVGDTMINQTATEAFVQTTMRTAGTFSNLSMYVTTNGGASTGTLVFRVNGADGSQTTSFGSGATGEFTDASNTDAVAVGDEVSYFLDRTGTSTIQEYYSYFEANTGLMVKTIATGPNTFGTASVTRYIPLAGDADQSGTEVALLQHPILTDATMRNMFVYVSANARTSTTTFRNRINGGDGTCVINVGAGLTGIFEDTTHSDAVVAGDVANSSVTYGVNAGNITYQLVSYEMIYSGLSCQMFSGNTTGASYATTSNRFSLMAGSPIVGGSEATSRVPLFGTGTVSNAEMYVLSNAATGDSVFTVRKNGANTAVTITVGAGATGSFTDSTHSTTFTNGQDFNWLCAKADAGATVVTRYTFVITFDAPVSTFIPRVMMF